MNRGWRERIVRVCTTRQFRLGLLLLGLLLTAWAMFGAQRADGDLWKLPGTTSTELGATSWELPADPAGLVGSGLWLMLAIAGTLLLGVLVSLRWFPPSLHQGLLRRRRTWHVAAAIAATLAYVVAGTIERVFLGRVVAQWDQASATFVDLNSGDVLWMSRFYNSKQLCLAAAVLLTASLWNRRTPTCPGRNVDEFGRPHDWYASDNMPGTAGSFGRHAPGGREWEPSTSRFGISVSGGGIRSASFAFGVLEELRGRGFLKHARYVTSVSGGSYATAALEHANRNRFKATKSIVRLRRRLNYLMTDVSTGLAGAARMLLGLFINLCILAAVTFLVACPLGWLIGTPLVQEGLRVDQPFVVDVVHNNDDDPDQEGAVQDWQAECDLTESPDDRPTIVSDPRDVGADQGQAEFRLTANPQCALIRQPNGAEEYTAFDVETTTTGIIAFDDGVARIVRQPEMSPSGSDLLGRPLPAGLVELRLPDIQLSDQASAVRPGVKVSALLKPPPPVEIDGVSIADRRSGIDVDLRHVLIPLVALGLWVGLWAVSGNASVRRWMERDERRPWCRAVRRLPTVAGVTTVVLFLVFLVLPAIVDALPNALVAPEPSTETEPLVSWLPASVPVIAAWPILAVVSLMRLFKGRKVPSPSDVGTTRNTKALIVKALVIVRNVAVTVVLMGLALVGVTTVMTTAALNGPFGSHAWIATWVLPYDVSWPPDLLLWSGVAAVLMLFAVPFPASSWSLGPFYRARLGWAFTGNELDSGRLDGSSPSGAEANPRAGFIDGEEGDGTELAICCAANIVGPDRAPAGRNAVSFSASRTWIGGPELGWLPTGDYLGRMGKNREQDVTIAAMMALSGAAVSPAMGKGSLGPVGSALAVLNVRLGGWLPHPGAVAAMPEPEHWRHTPGWPYFMREVTRRHRHESPYVYVSDGGHWENLGLVEVLRRGCNTVIAISASGDGSYSLETFANAVEIARTDLGIDIQMDSVWDMRPRVAADPPSAAQSGRQYLLQEGDDPKLGDLAPFGFSYGTFRRDNVPAPDNVGEILLIEATMVEGLPADVHAYAEQHHEFPNVNTGDQFFQNRDFDAYRLLGRTITEQALDRAEGARLADRIADCSRAPSVP